MPLQIDCPNCQTTLEIPDNALGKQVQCPTCTGLISIAADPEKPKSEKSKKIGKKKGKRRREEERARRENKKGGQSKLFIFIGIGVAVVLGLGALIFVITRVAKPREDVRVNGEAYDNIESGMTLAELEKMMGSGHEASASEVREIVAMKKDPDTPVDQYADAAAKGQVYRWKNGKIYVLVIFNGPPKTGGTAFQKFFVAPEVGPQK